MCDHDEPINDPGGGGLLPLAVRCPRCARRPALRVSAELLQGAPAAGRLGTYRCQGRRCGTIYDLPRAMLGGGP